MAVSSYGADENINEACQIEIPICPVKTIFLCQ